VRPQVDTGAARRGPLLEPARSSPSASAAARLGVVLLGRGIWGPTRTCMWSSEPHLGCSRGCGRAEGGSSRAGSAGQHEAAQPGTVALPPQRAPSRACGLGGAARAARLRRRVDTGRGAARRGAGRGPSRTFCVCCCATWRGLPSARHLGPTRRMHGVLESRACAAAGAGGRAEVGVVTSGSAGRHEAAQPGTVALPPQRARLSARDSRRRQSRLGSAKLSTGAARGGAAGWLLERHPIQPFCVWPSARLGVVFLGAAYGDPPA